MTVIRSVCAYALLAVALLAHTSITMAQQTVVLRGRVVENGTNRVLPGALIEVPNRAPIRADAEGRFAVVVPASAPAASVTKPGFVREFARPSRGEEIVVRMRRGGVLTVYVFDASVEPQSTRVSVRSVPGGTGSGSRLASSNDEGQLRLPNLEAGQYMVTLDTRGTVFRLPLQTSELERLRLRDQIRRLSQTGMAEARQTVVDVRAGEETLLYLVDTSPSLPGRDIIDLTGAITPAGTAAIRGQVSGPDDTPIANAIVRLRAGGFAFVRATISDAAGAFAFEGLPAGELLLSASKPQFVVATVGAEPASGEGVPIALAAGQQRTDVQVTMAPWSVVSGTVRDQYGDPVEGAAVILLRRDGDGNGSEGLSPSGRGSTDDRGRYRVIGVRAGSYYVFTHGVDRNPGDAHLFYAGEISSTGAHLVQVAPGNDVVDVDFRLNPALGVRVYGTAVDDAGRPLSDGEVQLEGIGTSAGHVVPRSVRIGVAGTFEFLNVAPGDYELVRLPAGPRGRRGTSARRPDDDDADRALLSVTSSPPPEIRLRMRP